MSLFDWFADRRKGQFVGKVTQESEESDGLWEKCPECSQVVYRKYLIDNWLSNKGNYMAGKAEINLSAIVKDPLIKRTIEERQKDIKKGIYKEISSEIEEIVLKSQTSSGIVALAKLKYRERIFKNSGELVNETSLNPLKVKYILGFSNKSWKLADFVSGL